jgi:hypothetical protein
MQYFYMFILRYLISRLLLFFVRFRCPGFGAILVTCGMVRWLPVEVKVEDALLL